jgi:hypothetical protein
MIDLGRKFFIYFVAGLTLLFTFKALPNAPLSWRLVEVAIVFIAVICAIFAWDEVKRGKGLTSRRDASEDASVSLSLKRAMSSVKFAARNDESIAREARLRQRVYSIQEIQGMAKKEPHDFHGGYRFRRTAHRFF